VDEARAREVLRAAADYLQNDARIDAPKIGTIGWCFGGGWSLDCALTWEFLDAAVIYYGRLVDDPARVGKIQAAVCGVFGNKDQGIPPASVDTFEKALKDAGVKHEIWRYDADHAFANPSGARYDAANASAAWENVRAFLARELKAE
jgi:carboxymethylenebutenolidase